MGTVDFSNLKIKLIASIVAISAIAAAPGVFALGRRRDTRRSDPAALDW
jgi:hypothetical protein